MRVVGYTRVSTAEQAKDGWTLASQRKAIEAEAERRGWELVAVIEDAGYTGTNENRPGLRQVLAMLKKRQARAVIVARLDRLRNARAEQRRHFAGVREHLGSILAFAHRSSAGHDLLLLRAGVELRRHLGRERLVFHHPVGATLRQTSYPEIQQRSADHEQRLHREIDWPGVPPRTFASADFRVSRHGFHPCHLDKFVILTRSTLGG